MTALHTLGILSTSFMRNDFPTVLKEFPHMLSTCWLHFLNFVVQLIPNHLNWVEVGWLWRTFKWRTKHPHTITPPPPCFTVGTIHAENIRSPTLRLTKTRRLEPKITNLDSSDQRTDFHRSNVRCSCFLAQASLFFLLVSFSSGFFAAIRTWRADLRSLRWTRGWPIMIFQRRYRLLEDQKSRYWLIGRFEKKNICNNDNYNNTEWTLILT